MNNGSNSGSYKEKQLNLANTGDYKIYYLAPQSYWFHWWNMCSHTFLKDRHPSVDPRKF